MFGKTRVVFISLTITAALLLVWAAAGATRFSSGTIDQETPNSRPAPPPPAAAQPLEADESALGASPCVKALAERSVCAAASRRALEIMAAKRLAAVTVVQDVRTGAVVAFAASQPSDLDLTTLVSPLSLSKLLLAASWWDNRQPDASFESTRGTPQAKNPAYRSRVSVHETLVGGSDSAGRQMAITLRKSVGTRAVLEDFKRYGFGQRADSRPEEAFWGEIAPAWKTRLTPAAPAADAALSEEMSDADWAETLSIGETNIKVTALHVSRFLQAVGNGGVMLTPTAREERPSASESAAARPTGPINPVRVMQEGTARRLQSAMRDTVRRGTAASIAQALEGAGSGGGDWQIGGKTGSGTALLPKGSEVDGWFAGLIFDPRGKARFTVATFVRSGGYGGANAAQVSAALARYLIGEPSVPGR